MKIQKLLFFVLMLSGTTLSAKSPYAEMLPWVPGEVWEAPFMEMDEFLEKYGIPRKGSIEPDSEIFDKRKEFNPKFFGLLVDETKFAVVERHVGDRYHYFYYTLRDLSERKLTLKIRAFKSEQESLNVYPGTYVGSTMHQNYFVVCAERIPWGTFCRRIMNPRGGFLDFVNGGLGVQVDLSDKKPVDLLPAGKEIDALFRGKSEFLPEDDPELVAIRKAYQNEQEKRAREWQEELARRKKAERAEKLQNFLKMGVEPSRNFDFKEFSTRFELLKKHLKPRRVPAGTRDPDEWKKLSLKTVEPLFTKYEFSEKGVWHPFNFGFSTWRIDDEIRKTKPLGISYRVEIAHAKDFAQAWDWALYFRLKYSAETEQRARLSMSQLAQATNQNAFPRLGDINISWRGRMDSSFLPEEETAESLIIFIRGTTVVCVRSERTDSSALPLARLLDKQLVDGIAPEPDEFYLPSTF